MRNKWTSRVGLIALLAISVTGAGLATGCSDVDPINRVQPDYIKKSDLVGPNAKNPYEWYIRNTVIDTTRSNSYAFPGVQDELKRVRWDIQENHLIARKSYEAVSGSDGHGADPAKNDGIVVASYPITRHFDIQRDYNRSTGEENNVVVENSDRAWYEREFIRVDWKTNEVTDPDGLFWFDKIFQEVKFTTSEMVTDPNSKFAPVYKTGEGYLDITTKRSSAANDFNGWGVPECGILNWITGSDVMECNEQEIAVRTSFMRVPDRDYEAMETDSEKWAMFGTFNRDRWGFSRQYEILDKNWHRLVGRHNLWKASHADKTTACYNPAPGADAAQARKDADAACASKNGKGSRCDMFAGEAEGKQGYCTLPLAKREVKAVAYFVSQSMPKELWDTNQIIINQWNDGIVNAIAVGREVECRQDGGDKDTCHNQWFSGETPKANNGPAIVLCHNPTAKGDHASCGAEGTIAREGDMRYNLIGWVDTPLSAAPLGYGPNGADPLTGEVIQSTAYIYGASLDSYATMARDLILVANGELDPAAFASGSNITGSIGKYESTGVKELFQPYRDYLQGTAQNVPVKSAMTDAQIAAAHRAVDASQVVARIGAAGVAGAGNATQRLQMVHGAIAAQGVNGQSGFGGRAEALSRMDSMSQRLSGTQTETNLIGSADWMRGNAPPVPILADPTADAKLIESVRKTTSPFGGAYSPFQLETLFGKMNKTLEDRGECMFGANEFNAPHFEGLAKKMAGKFQGDPQGLFMELRKLIYKAVTEHEVGHTMSMRHNFQGSWDSMNFHPNYWKLRTKNGTATKACTKARAEGDADDCMGPRYLDPETKDETGGATGESGIEEFAYSSIMDYGYDFNTDLHGLGSYDRAMMKFVYGNAVETFQAGSKVGDKLASLHSIPGTTTPRGLISEQWWVKRTDSVVGGGEQVQPTHYTTLARIMQDEKLIYDEARCREPRKELGEDNDTIGGVICAPPVKDHAHISELQSGEAEKGIQASLYKTADGRIRWPYRFGTDEYSNHPHNLRFDAGADVYEAATNVAKLYEYRYLLDFWRRGRRGYLSWSIGNRVWGRYFSRFQSIGWLSASKITSYSAMYPGEANNPALKSLDWGEGYVLASNALFNTLKRSLLRPQPGTYATKQAVPGRTIDLLEVPDFNPPASASTAVSILDGRWIDDDLNNAKGGSFHYSEYHDRAGTDAEKPIAFAALAAQFPPINTYYSRDTYVDGRNMLLNFRSIYPQAYDRLMAGVLANDTDVLSAYATGTAVVKQGKFSVIDYADVLDPNYKYAAGSKVIDPLVGFRLQVPGLIYGLWFGEDDGTRSFQNSARVWIDGSAEGVTLPEADKVYFFEVDANGGSGVLWAARNFGTETLNGTFVRSKGIGHRMIHHANLLLAGLYAVQTNADGTPKYDAVTHRPLWEAGMEGKTRAGLTGDDLTAATTEYKRYNGLLNVARNLFWDSKASLNGF